MSDSIHVKLPDGSTKEVPKGSTALDVAKSISPRLADAALAAKMNGDLIDLTRPLENDTDLRILTEKHPEALEVYRHSSAHLPPRTDSSTTFTARLRSRLKTSRRSRRKCRNSSSRTCLTRASFCRARKVWRSTRAKATS